MLKDATRIGKYEIDGVIARGGMAIVYRVRQPPLDRFAALKRLELPQRDPAAVARFIRECRISAALEHPNIVTVLDFFKHDGVPHMAMEYLSRGSLRPWIGELSEPQVLGVLEQLLAALAHAQQHGLAHRDLKPENVLLTRRGGIKVADFGIAKAYSHDMTQLTVAGTAVGTPRYMAPEQAQQGGVISPATDLYALGVMAYEMRCGRAPFEDERDPASLLYRHIHETPAALDEVVPDVAPALVAWVARLLAKDPADRPRDAVEAWQELEPIAVDRHGAFWRRTAPIAPAGASPGTLPEDLDAVVIHRTRDTSAETIAAADAAGETGRPLERSRLASRFLIAGPDATLEVRNKPDGAVVRHVTRWRRTGGRRRRRPLHPAPAAIATHVDRVDEIGSLARSVRSGRVVNVFGERAIGKTHVVVAALNGDAASRDAIYLDGRGQSAEDLLHALHQELYVSRTPIRDPQIARRLGKRSAVVAIEDVALGADEVRHLVDGAPGCRFILTSRERALWDGPGIRLAGMAPEHAPALAEQELGRPLDQAEQRAAVAVAGALEGHPLRLRQAFSRAAEAGAPLTAMVEELSQPPMLHDRLATLAPLEQRVVRALAVHGGASIANEHLAAIVGEPEVDQALERLHERHDVAVEAGRSRLLGVLAHALPASDDLATETGAAAAHFIVWLQGQATNTEAALQDMPAVLALIERLFVDGSQSEAIRLGRAAEGYLSARQRWAAWGLVLAIVLACARDLDDGVTEGWALNQLGVRSLGRGRTTEALRLLEQAQRTARRAGDSHVAAIAGGNLGALQRVPPPLPRLSHSPGGLIGMCVGVVAVIAVLIGLMGPDPVGPPVAIPAAESVVTVQVTGDGAGTVRSDRAATCRAGRCEKRLRTGTIVSLTAEPGAGSRFGGWRGAGCDETRQCRLVVRSDVTLRARFTRDAPTGRDGGQRASVPMAPAADRRAARVTVQRSGPAPGTIAVDGRADGCTTGCLVRVGDELVARATYDPATTAVRWRGAACEGATCRVDVSGDRAVVAEFVQRSFELTVLARGAGTVTANGRSCASGCRFAPGSSIVLVAEHAAATRVRWNDLPCRGGVCHLTLHGDRDVHVRFPERRYTLTIRVEGAGRVTGCAASRCRLEVDAGEQVSLTAAAAEGSALRRWSGCTSRAGAKCTVRMTRDRAVTADFDRRVVLTPAVTGDGGGTVLAGGRACAPSCTFWQHDTVQLTTTADPPATTVHWNRDGCDGASCSIALHEDTFIAVEIALRLHRLEIRVDGPGSVGCEGDEGCAATYKHGDVVRLHAWSSTESPFVRPTWSGCLPEQMPWTCSVRMLRDTVVTATFTHGLATLTTSVEGAGAVTVDGASCVDGCTFPLGREVTIAASAYDADDTTVEWSVPGCAGSRCTLVLERDTTVSATFVSMVQLGIVLDGPGSTDVCGTASCTVTVREGESRSITAVPADGGRFVGWRGCQTPRGLVCVMQLDKPDSVTAVFGEAPDAMPETGGTPPTPTPPAPAPTPAPTPTPTPPAPAPTPTPTPELN